MITKTAQVVQAINRTKPLKGYYPTMFNDKLVDGRRSLKVWQWTSADYKKAKSMLEKMGCKVEWVEFKENLPWRVRGTGVVIRLHIKE